MFPGIAGAPRRSLRVGRQPGALPQPGESAGTGMGHLNVSSWALLDRSWSWICLPRTLSENLGQMTTLGPVARPFLAWYCSRFPHGRWEPCDHPSNRLLTEWAHDLRVATGVSPDQLATSRESYHSPRDRTRPPIDHRASCRTDPSQILLHLGSSFEALHPRSPSLTNLLDSG